MWVFDYETELVYGNDGDKWYARRDWKVIRIIRIILTLKIFIIEDKQTFYLIVPYLKFCISKFSLFANKCDLFYTILYLAFVSVVLSDPIDIFMRPNPIQDISPNHRDIRFGIIRGWLLLYIIWDHCVTKIKRRHWYMASLAISIF